MNDLAEKLLKIKEFCREIQLFESRLGGTSFGFFVKQNDYNF